MKIKKLCIVLLAAALCLVAPAIAMSSPTVEWDMLPTDMIVWIDEIYSPGGMGTYFDVSVFENTNGADSSSAREKHGADYPGWCVDTGSSSIRGTAYMACLSSTLGKGDDWNRINWILNNKGSATYVEIEVAVLKILGQGKPALFTTADWNNLVSQGLIAAADPAYSPGPGDIGAVLIEPCRLAGQKIIIEVPIPRDPPVPEFPTLMVPVFLVGSLLVAAGVLKKE
ncbi:hypothetical protein [Methanogenium cariaci]|jgi:hypothetical protein